MAVKVRSGITIQDYLNTYGYTEAELRKANPELGEELIEGQELNLPTYNDLNKWMLEDEIRLQRDIMEPVSGVKELKSLYPATPMQSREVQDPAQFGESFGEDLVEEAPLDSMVEPAPYYLTRDEGFKLEPYTVGNEDGGVTVATGIDFGQHTVEGLREMGMPEDVIEHMMPAIGLTGKAADEMAKTLPPITEEMARRADAAVGSYTQSRLAQQFGDRWNKMEAPKKELANSLFHQYGDKFFKQNAFKQLLEDDTEGLRANLLNWGDTTDGVSDSINQRYARWAKRI